MEANLAPDGSLRLSMSLNEAVIVYELLSRSEFADDLEVIELAVPVERKVMSDIQQALLPCVPGLGTSSYSRIADAAYDAVDPGSFRDQ